MRVAVIDPDGVGTIILHADADNPTRHLAPIAEAAQKHWTWVAIPGAGPNDGPGVRRHLTATFPPPKDESR